MQAHHPLRREYNTSIGALYKALTLAKHKVDWRALTYGERGLDRYDLMILGLGTMSEFSCNYLYEVLWATQFDRVLFLVNDWKANATIQLLRDGDIFRDFVWKNNGGEKRADFSQKQKAQLEKLREKMWYHDQLIGPFFSGWGDRSIITRDTPFEKGVLHEFDPSAFYLKHWQDQELELTDWEKRKKQWVYGALSDYSRWHKRLHNDDWPIISFNKKSFIPEKSLMELYCKSMGIIFPRYKASGSGWWRARYCHAIVAKNVIYAVQDEIPVSSFPWKDMDGIEQMSIREVMKMATEQHEILMGYMPSWKSTVAHIDRIVKEWK